ATRPFQSELHSAGQHVIWQVPVDALAKPDDDECSFSFAGQPVFHDAQPTAVAYKPNGTMVAYFPERDAVALQGANAPRWIPLGAGENGDLGRDLFHRQTFSGLACASCHPE